MFWAAKEGHSDEEYEDAGCMASEIEHRGIVSRYAVADGATETSFAGAWARALVMAYCQGLLTGLQTDHTVKALRENWSAQVGQLSLPWYAEEKALRGAFATFCGLTVCHDSEHKSEEGDWQVLAIGDSCFFHVRKKRVIRSFPLVRSTEFGCSPEMLGSLSDLPATSRLLSAEGRWLAGDTFLLMTDALSCRFLTESEAGQLPSDFLAHMHSEQSFQKYLQDMRGLVDSEGTKQLRNDDVTVLIIRM